MFKVFAGALPGEIETFTAEESVVAVATIDYIVACTTQIDPAAIGCHVPFSMGLGSLIELARPMVNKIMFDRTNCDRQDYVIINRVPFLSTLQST